jgi:hypothetical protein
MVMTDAHCCGQSGRPRGAPRIRAGGLGRPAASPQLNASEPGRTPDTRAGTARRVAPRGQDADPGDGGQHDHREPAERRHHHGGSTSHVTSQIHRDVAGSNLLLSGGRGRPWSRRRRQPDRRASAIGPVERFCCLARPTSSTFRSRRTDTPRHDRVRRGERESWRPPGVGEVSILTGTG